MQVKNKLEAYRNSLSNEVRPMSVDTARLLAIVATNIKKLYIKDKNGNNITIGYRVSIPDLNHVGQLLSFDVSKALLLNLNEKLNLTEQDRVYATRAIHLVKDVLCSYHEFLTVSEETDYNKRKKAGAKKTGRALQMKEIEMQRHGKEYWAIDTDIANSSRVPTVDTALGVYRLFFILKNSFIKKVEESKKLVNLITELKTKVKALQDKAEQAKANKTKGLTFKESADLGRMSLNLKALTHQYNLLKNPEQAKKYNEPFSRQMHLAVEVTDRQVTFEATPSFIMDRNMFFSDFAMVMALKLLPENMHLSQISSFENNALLEPELKGVTFNFKSPNNNTCFDILKDENAIKKQNAIINDEKQKKIAEFIKKNNLSYNGRNVFYSRIIDGDYDEDFESIGLSKPIDDLYQILDILDSKDGNDRTSALRRFYLWHSRRLITDLHDGKLNVKSGSSSDTRKITRGVHKGKTLTELRTELNAEGSNWTYAGFLDFGYQIIIDDYGKFRMGYVGNCSAGHALRWIHIAVNDEDVEKYDTLYMGQSINLDTFEKNILADKKYATFGAARCMGDFFDIPDDKINALSVIQAFTKSDMEAISDVYKSVGRLEHTNNEATYVEDATKVDAVNKRFAIMDDFVNRCTATGVTNLLSKLFGTDWKFANGLVEQYKLCRQTGLIPTEGIIKELRDIFAGWKPQVDAKKFTLGTEHKFYATQAKAQNWRDALNAVSPDTALKLLMEMVKPVDNDEKISVMSTVSEVAKVLPSELSQDTVYEGIVENFYMYVHAYVAYASCGIYAYNPGLKYSNKATREQFLPANDAEYTDITLSSTSEGGKSEAAVKYFKKVMSTAKEKFKDMKFTPEYVDKYSKLMYTIIRLYRKTSKIDDATRKKLYMPELIEQVMKELKSSALYFYASLALSTNSSSVLIPKAVVGNSVLPSLLSQLAKVDSELATKVIGNNVGKKFAIEDVTDIINVAVNALTDENVQKMVALSQ